MDDSLSSIIFVVVFVVVVFIQASEIDNIY